MTRNVIVVAHPDDEVLWLSAVLAEASSVVLCFGDPFGRPDKAASRRQAVSQLRLESLVNLAIPEAGVLRIADLSQPLTATGLAIRDSGARARYDANFARLLTGLRPLLIGATDVYTHNEWGEYGHPEHVQVHRAVASLQAELGFTLWFSNYVGPTSFALAQNLGATPYWAAKRGVRPDVELAKRLRRVYLRCGAWTWSRLHQWPSNEVFYAQPAGDRQGWHSLRGEELLDVTALRFWRRSKAALRRID